MTDERVREIVVAIGEDDCPGSINMPGNMMLGAIGCSKRDCPTCWAEAIGRELDGEANV